MNIPQHALSTIFISHYEELKSFIVNKYGSDVLAEEVVQEAWLRLQRASFEAEIEQPRAYLFRMVANLAIDNLRAQNIRSRHLSHDEGDSEEVSCGSPQPDKVLDYQQRLGVLRQAVDELPPRCREVFLLHKFKGLSHAEIAERLGISKNMVEKHIIRGLAHCRDGLKKALQ